MAKQRIRIRLKAYDHRLLDQSAAQIVETAQRTGADVVGPVPLPTRIEKFTVIRSPFIDKDCREQFEIRTHKRLVDILDPIVEDGGRPDATLLAAGVDIEIKMWIEDEHRIDRPQGRHDPGLPGRRHDGRGQRRWPSNRTPSRACARPSATAIRPCSSAPRGRKLTKPEAGQLKDLPKGLAATVREFRRRQRRRLRGRPEVRRRRPVRAGDLVDVTGVSKGKGFAGHIKRHNFQRGPKTHGSDHHRAPGSIGPGTTPGRVYKGMKMAGHMGDERVTIKKVRVVRTDPERNLLLVKGTPARRAQLADPREEGLTMPQTTLYDRTGATVGSVELRRQLFAAPVNAAVLHQVVTAQLAGRRTGTHDTKTRGEVRGGGKKPYRQKGTGRARQGTRTRTALPGRRRRLRPAPALVRAAAAAQDEAARAARRADRQARRRARSGSSTPSGSRRSRPATSSASSARSRRPAACSSSRPARDENLELSARNLPTVEVILADSLNVVDLLNADIVLIEQPALRADGGGVRMTPDRSRGHPPPGHQREVDGRDRARQVHLRRPR